MKEREREAKREWVREESEGECAESELIMKWRGSGEEWEPIISCKDNLSITPESYA